jgi:excisionase family DNA binding protein
MNSCDPCRPPLLREATFEPQALQRPSPVDYGHSVVQQKDIAPDTLLTSHDVGRLIQVNPTSINKWVADGLIPAFRTPGGHRRIKVVDLLAFLETHKMPVPREIEGVAKRRVLIVDADSKHAKAVERSLKKHTSRIQALFVTNGIDALVQVGSFKPHLIVLDAQTTGVDGLDVCRRLKSNPETRDIKVLMTSAHIKADLEKKTREAGAAKLLQKPLDVGALLDVLGLTELSAA